MKYSDLIKYTRLFIKPATVSRVPNDVMGVILNKAKDDIAARLLLYKKEKEFSITEDDQRFYLSSIADDYLAIDESGIWYQDSNDEWNQMDAYTKKRLDVDYPNWRNNSSNEPSRYYIESDLLMLDSPSNLTTTGKIYYGAKPLDMAGDNDYPFHKINDQQSEIPQYSILDECIWAYASWWIEFIIMENEDEKVTNKRNHYTALIEEKRKVLYGRLDVLNSDDMYMRGPSAR